MIFKDRKEGANFQEQEMILIIIIIIIIIIFIIIIFIISSYIPKPEKNVDIYCVLSQYISVMLQDSFNLLFTIFEQANVQCTS